MRGEPEPVIMLIPPLRRPVSSAISRVTQWACLGASIRTRETVAQWLGSGPQEIALSDLLQQTAESLRTDYIDYIGKLGVERDSVDWWFSSLSEKIPTISNAFLHICYAAAAVELCRRRKHADTLVLIVENPAVRQAIAAHLRERNEPFVEVHESVVRQLAQTIRDWVEMLARRLYWMGRQTARLITSRALGFSAGVMNGAVAPGGRQWVLLHNCISARYFSAQGEYRDAYFGQLRQELLKRGLHVAVVATVLSHSPYRRILGWLKRSGMAVLVPEAALTLPSLFRWIRSLPLRPPAKRAWPRFRGLDVSDILTAVDRMDWINPRASTVRMISDVVAQWRRHIDLRAFIYTYEGQAWERGYCRALREQYPQASLIGYQHATVSPMWMSHFLSGSEWGKVPFPDRVVTNGRHHYDLLRRNGIPDRVLACGGAIRYGAFESVSRMPDHKTLTPPVIRVLVTLSVLPAQAAELLLVALRAFSDRQMFRVTLKFHPHFPAKRVIREAGIDSFPSHVAIREESVSDLLRDADAVLYTYTAAAIEALAHGVPIVHFACSCDIDLDPLASFDGIRVSTGTAEELREAVLAVTKVSAEAHEARVRRWREVVNLLLPPPDEKTIDLFMPENVR